MIRPGRPHQRGGGEAGRRKTGTGQDGWEGGKPSWLGQRQQLEVFSGNSLNKAITQYLFLLAVTLLKVTGQKHPEKSQERKGQESPGNLEKGGTSSDRRLSAGPRLSQVRCLTRAICLSPHKQTPRLLPHPQVETAWGAAETAPGSG